MLSESDKQHIDSLSYEDLLRHWRFAPVGDPWFFGETGDYWIQKMRKLHTNEEHTHASKAIGWGTTEKENAK